MGTLRRFFQLALLLFTLPVFAQTVTFTCTGSTVLTCTLPSGLTYDGSTWTAPKLSATQLSLTGGTTYPNGNYLAKFSGGTITWTPYTPLTGGAGVVGCDASAQTGADASVRINACIAAVIAAGGGIVDARKLSGSQTMSQSVQLGNTASVAANIGITLLLPDTATWTWNLTDGVSCGIYQYSSTSIIGTQPGGGGNRMVLTVSSGSKMDSIYCTDAPASGANYVRAEGFSAWNRGAGNTFANGIIHIRNAVDQSTFTRIIAVNYYGDAWHVDSACCGTKFSSIQGNTEPSAGGGDPGGVPLTISKGSVRDVSFYDSSFNQPAKGKSNILINSSGAYEVNFYNTYMEGNGEVDSTTPMVYVAKNVGPVHFFGGHANTYQPFVNNVVPSTKPVFANYGLLLDIEAMGVANTKTGVYDDSQTFTAPVTIPTVIWGTGNLGYVKPYRTSN